MALAKITKAQLAAQARHDYIENTKPVAIDMDGDRAYAVVPSQDGTETYRVYFVEPRDKASYATSCECKDHEYRKTTCKHMQIVNRYHSHIHESIRRPGIHEMDALVEQLEAEFGILEEVASEMPPVCPAIAPKKTKKVRRSAVNVELVKSLQVGQGVKVRKSRKGALVVKSPVVVSEMTPNCPIVAPQKAA